MTFYTIEETAVNFNQVKTFRFIVSPFTFTVGTHYINMKFIDGDEVEWAISEEEIVDILKGEGLLEHRDYLTGYEHNDNYDEMRERKRERCERLRGYRATVARIKTDSEYYTDKDRVRNKLINELKLGDVHIRTFMRNTTVKNVEVFNDVIDDFVSDGICEEYMDDRKKMLKLLVPKKVGE